MATLDQEMETDAGAGAGAEPEGASPLSEAVRALEAADDPAGRVEILLRLVEQAEGKPLRLGATDDLRVDLTGIDVSRTRLEARLVEGASEGESAPGWWEPKLRGLALRGADLSGVKLQHAILRGADLRGADLREASMGGADLRGVNLEGADLRGADLAGANLRGALLGNADLRDAMMEDADLRRAGLRFAKLGGVALDNADLRGADLWGADLAKAALGGADLRAVILKEANVAGADLSRANLRRADVDKADFSGANLTGADLRTARVMGAKFPGAILVDTHLDDLDLSQCNMAGVHLRGATLSGTRLRADQFGGAIGEESARAYGEARKGYLALERYFQDSGDPDAASWAYRRRRRMQKQEALDCARIARAQGRTRAAAVGYFNHISDQLVEWLCDYGESIPRVMASMFAVYMAFTIYYGATGSVIRQVGNVTVATRNPLELAIFSLTAITSANPPNGLSPRDNLVILITGVEALLGVAMTGLLGFVMGNLVRR